MGDRVRRRRPGRCRRGTVVIGAALSTAAVTLADCGGAPAASAGTPAVLPPAALARGAAHACAPGGGRPTVAWSSVRNPVLSDPGAGIKDEALVWAAGRWHLLFSRVTDDPAAPGGVTWNVGSATSGDLAHWSPIRTWPRQAGVTGVASPDVVRAPSGGYVVTYQSQGGPGPTASRLFYRTSADLEAWSAPHPLAPSLAPASGDRMIDGALAFTGHQLLLAFKYSSPTQPQVFELARSTTGRLGGPWVPVGRPDVTVAGGTVENYEFVVVHDRWRLVATSNNLDEPWMFTLAGDPAAATSWLHWTDGRQLALPSQPWNSAAGLSSVTHEHANSVFLCEPGGSGGTVYALYAGSTELTTFGGWGRARIGIARSTDLVHWSAPPPSATPATGRAGVGR